MNLAKVFGAHPDNMGSAEYRAMYELIDDTLKDCPPDERVVLAKSMCDEFLYISSCMAKDVEEYIRKNVLTPSQPECTVSSKEEP